MGELKRVAVLGAGGMGRFHAETLLSIPGVELAAVADPFPHPDLDGYDVPITTDVEACAQQGWDGVVIASPDDTHADLTLLALAAGSRVLCEKPLSHTIEGARSVMDAEVAIGERRVQVGFMREVDPAHVALAEQLATLGDLQYVRCTHRNTNDEARPPEVVVVNSLIHDLHTARWLAGDITEVDARVTTRPGGIDHVLLVLRMQSGATATVEFSDNTYAYEVEVEATAAGGMVMTSAPQRPRLRIDGDYRTPIGDDWFGWFAEAYRIQDRQWVASLRNEVATGPSVADGLAAQLAAAAAIESISNGAPVGVESFELPHIYT